MADVREGIDRLDEELVRLLATRAAYIDAAARIKAGIDWPARIESRVEQVVANVCAHGQSHGLPPALLEGLWRPLIEWSIAREEAQLGPDSLRPDNLRPNNLRPDSRDPDALQPDAAAIAHRPVE